jgi:hypothetical protein
MSGSEAGIAGGIADGAGAIGAGFGFGGAGLTAGADAGFAFLGAALTAFFALGLALALALTFFFAFIGRVFFFAALFLADARLVLAFAIGRFFDLRFFALLFFAMVTLLLDVFELVVRVAPKKSAVICADTGVVHSDCVVCL